MRCHHCHTEHPVKSDTKPLRLEDGGIARECRDRKACESRVLRVTVDHATAGAWSPGPNDAPFTAAPDATVKVSRRVPRMEDE